jgi:hypothetical protein
VVKKGLLYFLRVLTSQNFKTRLIMTDGEGAVGNLQTELKSLGIVLLFLVLFCASRLNYEPSSARE